MSVFIIAEAGVNHNGDADRALAMVDVAREAGADAIKFQSFSAKKLVARGTSKAEYQKRQTGEGDQFEMLAALEMSDALHGRLAERCAQQGIEFMSTPFDEDALNLLVGLGIKRIKAPSGELVNHPFLRRIASHDLPIILSTGMGTLDEIREAVEVIAQTRQKHGYPASMAERVTILHCTSNYPAEAQELNLRAMVTIAEATGLPVGYSDHSLGIAASPAAVALGAQVIEKHFTLDRALPGPDHAASLEPAQLKAMIEQIRFVEQSLGSSEKAPTAAELKVRDVARRSVAAAADLPADKVLREEDLVLLRPGTGIAPKCMETLLGRRLKNAVPAGQLLAWNDLIDG
jgi:N-acetylneuraminate synthase